MILGIGTDLIAIDRIAAILDRHGDRFLTRVFAPSEQFYAANAPEAPAHYAKRWAAKEAAAKALGIGIDQGVYLKDILVEKSPNGAPVLRLIGGAATQAQKLNAGAMPYLYLSLSDDAGFALAFVVMETSDC